MLIFMCMPIREEETPLSPYWSKQAQEHSLQLLIASGISLFLCFENMLWQLRALCGLWFGTGWESQQGWVISTAQQSAYSFINYASLSIRIWIETCIWSLLCHCMVLHSRTMVLNLPNFEDPLICLLMSTKQWNYFVATLLSVILLL